ncbi:hypothetical protein [Pseudidiomarina sp.]|uniref:hypothetical protein n=1 Tax=Pseudidiomarina sp. TaxID=2081707 RepID=UPI003A9708B3
MSEIRKIKQQRGLWLFIVPITGLVLTKAVGEEFTIDGITFVSKDKLPRIRKRLGFPNKISELEKKGVAANFFKKSKVYAIGKLGGYGEEKESEYLSRVRKGLDVLSLSQLGYGRRRNNACLSIGKEMPVGSSSLCMFNLTTTSSVSEMRIVGRAQELGLESRWRHYHRNWGFVLKLIEVINGDSEIGSGWRMNIIDAAILSGQSQSSSNLPHAFLWNMIAIETLLTQQGDTYLTELPNRVEAFIGWTTDWSIEEFNLKISQAYKTRSQFVHAGKSDQITIEQLLFTDTLILNIFINILSHLNIFYSKESLIEFSNKVQAERLLGIKTTVRPKTIRYLKPQYSDKDYEAV